MLLLAPAILPYAYRPRNRSVYVLPDDGRRTTDDYFFTSKMPSSAKAAKVFMVFAFRVSRLGRSSVVCRHV